MGHDWLTQLWDVIRFLLLPALALGARTLYQLDRRTAQIHQCLFGVDGSNGLVATTKGMTKALADLSERKVDRQEFERLKTNVAAAIGRGIPGEPTP